MCLVILMMRPISHIKLLLTDRQVSRLRKAFGNNLSTNIKLSKTQLSKIVHLGEFLGKILAPLLKNVLSPFGKSVLTPLGLTSAVSAKDAAIQRKMYGSGITILIISNEEMTGIRKIVKALKDSGLLIKGVSETIQNEAKHQKVDFLAC